MKLNEINARLLLSALKPLHAGWVMNLYNEITSEKSKDIIANGFRAAEITNAINLYSKNLPSINPFHGINPLVLKVGENKILQRA